MDVNQI